MANIFNNINSYYFNEFLFGTVPDTILFYIGLTFILFFNVPIVINKVNTYTFFVSILISVLATSILTFFTKNLFIQKRFHTFNYIFYIFPFLLLRLYFINYIPAKIACFRGFRILFLCRKDWNNYTKEEIGLVEKKEYFIFNNNYYDLNTIKNTGYISFLALFLPNVSADITHTWENTIMKKKDLDKTKQK